MKRIETALPGVCIFQPREFRDSRGFFMETWNSRTLASLGVERPFVQDNHSCSARGVLRGLHYQLVQPQGKLLRVAAGAAYDVAVDIRRSSQTFGRWVGVELSAENKRQLWVPPGFAHGFLSLTDDTALLYKCTDFYAPEHERCLLWSDPALAIDWPLDGIGAPHLAPRDAAATPLASAEVYA